MFSGIQGGSGVQDKAPRDENFWDMWKYTFCGNFKVTALPAVAFYIQLSVYVASIIISQSSYGGLNTNLFLGPSVQLLTDWGALYPAAMKNSWQYWRLVTPLFLSVGFQQFVFNSCALILLGFILEATGSGFANMLIIFLGSGIGGSFFGAICSSDLAVGSDIAYFGFVSALLAAAIVNWKALEPLGMMRLCLVMMIVFLFVILLLFTSVQQTVYFTSYPIFLYYDLYAHFGSFITGLFLGLMFMRRARRVGRVQESSFEKLCFKIGAAGLLFFFALLITLWFTVIHPVGSSIFAY